MTRPRPRRPRRRLCGLPCPSATSSPMGGRCLRRSPVVAGPAGSRFLPTRFEPSAVHDVTGRPRRHGPRGERGSATVWLLLLVPALVFATGLVVDGGRAITVRQEALGLASEAARAAVDQMDLSGYRGSGGARPVAPGAAQSAACTWIDQHRPDARCAATTHGQGRVEVTVTLTYRPVLFGAAGAGERVISASAQARPAIGDTTEVTDP